MASPKKKLRREDYHVAWIAPVSNLERLPARLMLDEEHDTPDYDINYDDNIYTCGSMVGHNVVIASCPPGLIGNVNAGQVAGFMFKTFANIRMALLVGIGGGVPRTPNAGRRTPDVRLGDVVVGWPGDGKPACVYYDLGKRHTDGRFEISGTIDRPDRVLLNALGALESDHEMDETNFQEHRERLLAWKNKERFAFPGLDKDLLFQADYKHNEESMEGCASCDTSRLVERPARTETDVSGFIFHRGRIATGNAVVRSGVDRDEISERCGGILCIEMEAAGVDASRPCLVVRGISDYADSHKNDAWQSYAAGNAAVFSRELLRKIPAGKVLEMQGSSSRVSEIKVPFVRNAQFAGRRSQLQRLKEHVKTRGSQRLAVHGLGGCGKTALVAELAYQLRDEDPGCAVFWVPALNAETFERAYQEIGVALAHVDIMSLVKDKLSRNDCRPWLMIIDNADDARLLLDSKTTGMGKRLFDYLPQSDKGSFIFTTRSLKAAVDLASTTLSLPQLTGEEAVDFIKKRLSDLDLLESDAVVTKFLEMLTYLPLAIVQAIAFINRNAVSLQQYVDLFGNAAESELRLLKEGFEDHTRYQDGVENNAVARTWRISFQQISIDDPLAASYLELMACLQRENIPTSVFGADDAIAKTKALGTLKAYAFITTRAHLAQDMADTAIAEEFYDMHRLVHIATQDWLKYQQKWQNKLTEALLVLIDLLPPDEKHKGWRFWVAYIPHGIHLASLCPDEGNIVEDKTYLLHLIGSCQNTLGQYRAMEKTSQEALSLCKRAYGEEHKGTLLAMNEVGVALSIQGRYEEAETIHRRTLALREKVSGKEHQHTLTSMSNLAKALSKQSKYAEAEIMHRETLALKEKVHGKEHTSTLVSMNEVGVALYYQGKHAEAEAIYRETLILEEKVLGREHPETLTTMHNLGQALHSQGHYAEAETILREVLVLREKVLGEEHPQTLEGMHKIGVSLSYQGNHTEAETIHREVLVLRKKILGENDPQTLLSMNELGVALGNQGRHTEAEKIFRETLVLEKKVLGMDHPSTQVVMRNLALLLRKQGKHEEADLLMSRITDV
ncbi:purine and uridine phosphorylase [Apiospora saccharicola]